MLGGGNGLWYRLGLVHVGLFFMCSGFLQKKNESMGEVFSKNVKRLWFPFVIFQLLFIILHNYLEADGWIYSNLSHYYLVLEHTFLMDVTEPLLSPMWFCTALFISLIIYSVIKTVSKRIVRETKSVVIELFFILNIMFIGLNLTIKNVGISWSFMNPQIINVSMVVVGILWLGNQFRDLYIRNERGRVVYPLSGLIAYLLGIWLKTNSGIGKKINVRMGEWENLFIYLLLLFLAWHSLYVLGTYVVKIRMIDKIATIVGKNTFWIMALHMLGLELAEKYIYQFKGSPGLSANINAISAIIFVLVMKFLFYVLLEQGKIFYKKMIKV